METKLLDKDQVAAMVGCHPRHIYRMKESGQLPPPIKVGKMLRWSSKLLEDWIAAGCPQQSEGGIK